MNKHAIILNKPIGLWLDNSVTCQREDKPLLKGKKQLAKVFKRLYNYNKMKKKNNMSPVKSARAIDKWLGDAKMYASLKIENGV